MIIKLPKNPINLEQIKIKNKRVLSEDHEKGGLLCKILVFIKMNEPVSNDEIKELLHNYYFNEFDKSKIKLATKRLNDLGMLNSITSGDLMTMPSNERDELHTEAYRKFFLYLEHIPKQFRRNYNRLTYYWINNKEGLEYVEWACKILGFDVQK